LVCIAPIVPTTGAHVYRGLSAELDGSWDVSAVTPSGFGESEVLPLTWTTLIGQLADAVVEAAGSGPLVLLGTSTGGLLAHEVAGWLGDCGRTVDAVVLLDTYLPNSLALAAMRPVLWREMYARQAIVDGLDWTRLSATARYEQLLAGWRPRSDINCPTLHVRAATWMSDVDMRRWQADVPGVTEVLDTPGDHLSILHQDVASTAELAAGWLQRVCQEGPDGYFARSTGFFVGTVA
jgi:thioesterase domain-containing protein